MVDLHERRLRGQFIGNRYGAGSGEIWLDNVQCHGMERTFAECRHSDWGSSNCTHDNDVSVSCISGKSTLLGYQFTITRLPNTPCPKKTKQICFCQNVVKFPQISIFFGRKMGNDPNICEVHSISTSSNLRHHLTVLNANVPNCYITPYVVICNKLLTT